MISLFDDSLVSLIDIFPPLYKLYAVCPLFNISNNPDTFNVDVFEIPALKVTVKLPSFLTSL